MIREARRTQSIALGLALLIAAVMIYNSGCGGNARRTTLAAELATLNTARDVFVSWDISYQNAIVDKALKEGATKDETKRRVQAYRATVQLAVIRAFAAAYDAISNAALDDKKPIPSTPDIVKSVRELHAGQDPPDSIFVPCRDQNCKEQP